MMNLSENPMQTASSIPSDSIPRPEYPRPQLVRDSWTNLNGEWDFAFDEADQGLREHWYRPGSTAFDRRITVPFSPESKLGGISETGFHHVVWYRKGMKLEAGQITGRRLLLHFGAVDYHATVWVNGEQVRTHEGGHSSFTADITDYVLPGDNSIVVRAQDFPQALDLPRGKQFWEEQSRVIWYTRTTGIWQTVWLESVPEIHVQRLTFTPDIDRDEIRLKAILNRFDPTLDLRLKVEVRFGGSLVAVDEYKLSGLSEERGIRLHDFMDHGMDRMWWPERPNLYDAELILTVNGQETDRVASYFGMRKVSIDGGKLCLNNRPYKLRMVLDQGYFPDGILTAPTDDDLKRDVELMKEMGFNGARKHQKVEDPRYLYWCDKLGLLVWGEMANAMTYSEEYVRRMTAEWQEILERDYNHPCIVAWVPLNESWGVCNIKVDVRQQMHARTMYYLTKSLDPTRPVVSNDGWEMVESDLICIHDYEWREEVLTERYLTAESAVTAKPANRDILIEGVEYRGQPVLLTEFGGISYKKSDWEGWGYSGAENEEDFLARLTAVVRPAIQSPALQGFCYTQLTDVEQEINGLLTYDRVPKAPLEKIRAIVEGRYE